MSNQSSDHKNWLFFALGAGATILISATGLMIFNKSGQSALAGTWKIEASAIGCLPDIPKLSENAKVRTNPFVNQAFKARQSEAKINVRYMNRGQVAYYVERQKFAKTIDEIEFGLKPESENYRYSIKLETSIKTNNIEDYKEITIQTAIAKKPKLKSYLGVVYLSDTSSNNNVFITLLCESNAPTTNAARSPKFDGKEMKCPDGYTAIS